MSAKGSKLKPSPSRPGGAQVPQNAATRVHEKDRRAAAVTPRYAAEANTRLLTEGQLLLCSFTLVGVLYAGVSLLLVPSFRTNDDVAMAMWAQGVGLGVAPTEYIVFTNVLIGFMLKGAYLLVPSVPWYGIYLYTALGISTALTFFAILRHGPLRGRLWIPVLLSAVVYIEFFARLQFTIVAFLVAQSGVVLFLSIVSGDERSGRWRWLVISAVLIAAGAAIRSYSCALVLMLALPSLGISFWSAPDRRAWLRSGGALVGAVVVGVGLEVFNRAYYATTPGWANFFELNALVAQFTDYHGIVTYTRDTKPIFDAIGWSYTDFRMLSRWFFSDPEVFSAEKMRHVLAGFAGYRTEMSAGTMVLLVTGMINDSAVLRAMIFSTLLFALLGSRRGLLILGGTVLSVMAAVAYLLLFLKLPDRVSLPMFGFVTVIAALYAQRPIPWRIWAVAPADRLRGLLVGVLAILLAWQLVTIGQVQHRRSGVVTTVNRGLRNTIARLRPAPEQLFVVWGAALPMEYFLPTEPLDGLRDFKMLGMGATGQSPLAGARMREFGITDVYRSLFERDDMYVIAEAKDVAFYKQYVKEHYGVAVEPHEHFKGRTFRVYKIAVATPPTP